MEEKQEKKVSRLNEQENEVKTRILFIASVLLAPDSGLPAAQITNTVINYSN